MSHQIQESGCTTASIQRKSIADTSNHVYLVPSASEPLREGFVRVINHSANAGEVRIDPVDDGGRTFDALTLAIKAGATVHFNSGDLENGNAGKGLTGSTDSGQGDWRLAFTSDLDIEVLSYIRTQDGFLTAMHDVAPGGEDVRRVAIFNPGSNRNQVGRLRLVNPSDAMAEVTIRGTDDRGMPGAGEVTLSLEPGTAREITAAELESGTSGLTGSLGDGTGKWRLEVESAQPVVAMSLLESPTDHLTNLSTVPPGPVDGKHTVPLFPAAGDASGRQGFLRVVNRSETDGQVRIAAFDESDWHYEPLTLSVGANEVVHFNSDDLEQGNAQKGLSGGTGAGEGDWRLELTSDVDIEVLAYVRTEDGFLTAMHDVAPSAGNRHRVAVFNPGSNRNQESLLRLVNPGVEAVDVRITGIDGNGAAGAGDVRLTIPAGRTRTLAAWELEDGGDGLEGSLGDGAGKWQLNVISDAPVVAMSLLRSPTGHLTNLSTAPARGAKGSAGEPTADEVFRDSISPIVQSKCVNCHVEGGQSGNTRLVFMRAADDANHLATNLAVFESFLEEVDDGANYLLNKIQGALGHGGGIQVAAGTDEYAAMERFLSLLGEDVGPVAITPETLFDGVTMESARSTLRRAAIVFAGRIPTDAEYDSILSGGLASLRKTIRGLMEGPGFHEFLLRAGNDRLLTDRELDRDIFTGLFVEYTNTHYDLLVAAAEGGNEGAPQQALAEFQEGTRFGAARAPLELIAHVVENDLPYTEILTADYIMANPVTAEAYGAATEFEDPGDVYEFKPSRIVSYYRDDDSKVTEYSTKFGLRVIDPGNLATDYPHAGILNTTVFLSRYPSTATNRNRARSRWTYYHFLGLDVEKSASRTTDPVALADTNNPTMNNPACTVCHSVLDPVAGAFQNYGDEGWYRDEWGGLDSLDSHYKDGKTQPSTEVEVNAESTRKAPDTVSAAAWVAAGSREIGLRTVNRIGSTNIHVDYLTVRDESGVLVKQIELEDFGDGDRNWDGVSFEICCETLIVPIDVPSDGTYSVEAGVWLGYQSDEVQGRDGTLSISIGGPFYKKGDTWYRDMREPGFDGELAQDANASVPWLARRISEDDRFSEATVRFWWPAIMGENVVEPPAEGDADFDGRLLASNAQTAEVERLAKGLRRGFHGGQAYDLKDLLAEVVLSRWFRASAVDDADPIRAAALAAAGAKRLLTPEELASKTAALTGFDWGRGRGQNWRGPGERLNWTDTVHQYGLLYGGIDSDGITKRGRDLTSVMAGVARLHASAVSCPVVLKDFYFVDEEDRRLFGGVDRSMSPAREFSRVFEIAAASRSEIETLSVEGELPSGSIDVTLAFLNDFRDEERGDRDILLDRLTVYRGSTVVHESEMEDFEHLVDCDHVEQDALHLSGSGSECLLSVPVEIPQKGKHRIEIAAWGDHAGDELPKLEVALESDTERSAGSRAIKAKLVELHEALLGVEADEASADVEAAYELFVDVWRRGRNAEYGGFLSNPCEWRKDSYYFDGIADHLWRTELDEWGNELGWDWDAAGDLLWRDTDLSDPHYVARTWVVVLAYLMTDPRYLHL